MKLSEARNKMEGIVLFCMLYSNFTRFLHRIKLQDIKMINNSSLTYQIAVKHHIK